MSNWLAHHPLKNNPEAWLWVGLGTKNKGKLISYEVARKILRTLAKRAGIKKKVNPHNFRHSRATQLAPKLPGKCLNIYFDWTMNSRQPARYIHLSGGETDDDGLTNLEEYQEGTDPNVSDAQAFPWWILGAAAVIIGIAAVTILWRRRK